MPGQTRSKGQRERDRATLAEMLCRGRSRAEMAAAIGVSLPTVYNELAAIRKQWQADTHASLAERQVMELAKLDEIEREALQAFERSRKPAKRYEATVSTRGLKASFTTENQVGDPRWLAVVLRCIDQRCDLLGLTGNRTGRAEPATPTARLVIYEPGGPNDPNRRPAPASQPARNATDMASGGHRELGCDVR